MSTAKNLLLLAVVMTAVLVGFGVILKLYWRLFLFGWGLV